MAKYELIRVADGVRIQAPRSDVDPNVGTKAGLVWRLVEETTAGSGPVTVSTVRTVLSDKITYVITTREFNQGEIDARKTADSTEDANRTIGKMLALLSNGMLRDVNERRVAATLPALSRAEFLDYMKGNAVPNSAAPSAAGSISLAQFIAFLAGL